LKNNVAKKLVDQEDEDEDEEDDSGTDGGEFSG
jgi:hypothetical protein